MAKPFKPVVSYTDNKGVDKRITVKTYAEVKKRMAAFMKDSFDENVNVYRHRKGEWGEWHELWAKIGDKCHIIKKGWL